MKTIRRTMTRIGSRYRYRVVMGLLIVSLPVTIALAVLLTQQGVDQPDRLGRTRAASRPPARLPCTSRTSSPNGRRT